MRRFAALVFLSLATSATAQDFTPSPLANILPSITRTDPLGIVLREREERATGQAFVAPSVVGSLSFVRSQARQQQNYRNFLAKSLRADPAGAAGLREVIGMDPIARMAPELARYGLSTDNVADAYAVYWMEAWQGAHGRFETGTSAQASMVRRQAAAALSAVPQVANAGITAKQEMADALLVQAMMIATAKEQARGNPAKLRQVGLAVRQGARASGIDLDAMRLTPEGFVPARRKVGAADPAGVAAPVLADNSRLWLGLGVGGLALGGLWLARGHRTGTL